MTTPPSDQFIYDEATPINGRGFALRCYTKDFEFAGFLAGYESITCTLRYNAISTADIEVRMDHERVPDLLLPGARIAITYDSNFLMSGRFVSREAALSEGSPTVTFHLASDFQFLSTIVGWPNPSGPASQQGAIARHDKQTGPASEVAHHFIQANADRLGLPLQTYGTWSGLGDTITVKARMDTLADLLVDKVSDAGVGIQLGGFGGDACLELRFFVPEDKPDVIDVASGAVVDWSWSQQEPTVTRVVIGGAGEGTAREYYTAAMNASWYETGGSGSNREGVIGTKKEIYVDARDIGADYEAAIKDVPAKLTVLNAANAKLGTESVSHDARYTSYVNAQQSYLTACAGRDATEAGTPARGLWQERVDSWYARMNALEAEVATISDTMATLTGDVTAALTAYNAAVALRDALKISTATELHQKAIEALTEGKTQYGIRLTLAETETFRYGKSFKVGDRIRFVDGPIDITDVVREVTLSKTVSEGLLVTPTVGTADSITSPHHIIYRAVRKLRAATRRNEASR